METMQKMSPFSFFFQMADFFFFIQRRFLWQLCPGQFSMSPGQFPIRVSFLVSLHLGDMESI